MGVLDGSVFAVTVCMIWLPGSSSLELIVFSFIGSALSIVLVFGMASLLPGGLSPVRLAILGTIIGTFLSSISAALASYFQISQNISFWYNARLHQMDPELIKMAIPFAVIGITLAVGLSRSISVLSLGEEVAGRAWPKDGMDQIRRHLQRRPADRDIGRDRRQNRVRRSHYSAYRPDARRG